MKSLKNGLVRILRWSEAYTKTNMIYLVKNSFWVNAHTVTTNAFVFLLSILFARFVSKDVYGTYQFLISLGGIIGGATLMGMNSAVTQAVARGFEGTLKASVYEQLKFLYIPFVLGILGSGYYLFFNNLTLSVSLALIAILLPISNAFNTWSAYISGKADFKHLFLYNQIINILYYGGLIALIFISPQTITLILGTFLLNTLANIFIYFIVIKKHTPNTQIDTEALQYGKKLSLSSVLPLIALHIDNLIIFHFLGPAQLAIYAFASNIPERLGGLLRPISTIALPKLSTINPQHIPGILRSKIIQLFMLSVVSGLIYILVAPLMFNLLFPLYTSSIIYSQAYAVVTILSITAGLPLAALFATRSTHIFTLNIAHPLYSIVFMSIGVYFYGIPGVIGAKIISGVLLLIQSYTYSQKS